MDYPAYTLVTWPKISTFTFFCYKTKTVTVFFFIAMFVFATQLCTEHYCLADHRPDLKKWEEKERTAKKEKETHRIYKKGHCFFTWQDPPKDTLNPH